MNWNRRALLGALAALPLAADAKPKHDKHDKHQRRKPLHPDKKLPKHQREQNLEELSPTPRLPEEEPTPEPEATPEATPTRTKKQRKHARQQSTVSAAAVAASPAPKLVTRYYGAANNHVDAYQPWSFKPGLQIKDAQREKSPGVPSTWELLDAGPFNGADCFCFGRTTGGHSKEGGNNWASYDVRRNVRMGYVWRDGGAIPSWLNANNGWSLAGTVDAKNVDKGWGGMAPGNKLYVKDFSAGTVKIPGPSDGVAVKILPWILFAEEGGAIPQQPVTSQAQPKPNQTCPVWLHDSRKSRTGQPTWHPIADETHHCYYGTTVKQDDGSLKAVGVHDHGSDWKWLYPAGDGGPNFDEIAQQAVNAGMMTGLESHFGHKCYVMEYPHEGIVFGVVHHFGTTGLKRIDTRIQRFHLLEIHARSIDRRRTLMVLRFMADYGISIYSRNQDQDGTIFPGVGNEATGLTGTSPSRQIPGGTFFINPNNLAAFPYEPWNSPVDLYKLTLGFGGNLVLNTQDGLTGPKDPVADTAAMEAMNRSGTARFFTPNRMAFHNPGHGNSNGYWTTDVMASEVIAAANVNAKIHVRQFFDPSWDGFEAMVAGTPEAAHMANIAGNATAWGDMYTPGPGGIPGDFENSITEAHGPN